jgi:hypothetical protein
MILYRSDKCVTGALNKLIWQFMFKCPQYYFFIYRQQNLYILP